MTPGTRNIEVPVYLERKETWREDRRNEREREREREKREDSLVTGLNSTKYSQRAAYCRILRRVLWVVKRSTRVPMHWMLIFFLMESAEGFYLLGHLLLTKVQACIYKQDHVIEHLAIDRLHVAIGKLHDLDDNLHWVDCF